MSEEKTVLQSLLEELKSNPEGAVQLLSAMENVVRPWESLRADGTEVMYSFRRLSATGEEVALIESSAPTWILTVKGQRFIKHKVFNRRGADEEAKKVLDAELAEMGYVLMGASE